MPLSERREETLALTALGAILLISVGWWAAALWPLPTATPEWVVRARAACFGTTESGLPNAGGWILLVGTPLTMLAALLVIWGGAVRGGLWRLARSAGGRRLLAAVATALVVGGVAAYARVASAYVGARVEAGTEPATRSRLARLDREAPPLALQDHHGRPVRLEDFRGRPVLLTFAYGKCETVCPVIVQSVRSAQAELAELAPVVLVVTLDPWRDTPLRLPHIAETWRLPADAYLLGGDVAAVEATLDAWQVARSRDPRTGEVLHPSLVYVIDADGRIAFAVTGNAEQIVQAARRL